MDPRGARRHSGNHAVPEPEQADPGTGVHGSQSLLHGLGTPGFCHQVKVVHRAHLKPGPFPGRCWASCRVGACLG